MVASTICEAGAGMLLKDNRAQSIRAGVTEMLNNESYTNGAVKLGDTLRDAAENHRLYDFLK